MRLRSLAAVAGAAAITAAATLTPAATLASAATFASAGVSPATTSDVVRTDRGSVRGLVGADTRTFRGIPYAAPPTGQSRWRSPQPASAWPGVRDATQYAATCPQAEHPVGVASTNEDCLFLDVTTPKAPARNRPVLVWIHGGSFKNGATSVYGPTRLAAQGDLVVVQIQYRLGALGFLASPLLGKESGNFGLEDQQAALRWVQRNAAAFGGDPRNVTIMGESAGGYSVCDQLASPTAAGLFQRAIIQSGPCAQEYSETNYAAPRPRVVAEKYGRGLASSLGCTTARCLRDVPVESLLAANATAEFGPVLGGSLLPLHPAKALATGRTNRVPVLHGLNHDEEHGRIAAQEMMAGTPVSEAAYEAEVGKLFGADAAKVLAAYADVHPAGLALATVLTDSQWSSPAAKANRLLAARMPTYTFEFAGNAPWYAGLPEPTWPRGSHHVSDVAYLFDLALFNPLDPTQAKLSEEVIARWSAFARAGKPNTPTLPSWPRATPADRTVQSLNPAGTTRTDFVTDHRIGFWQSIER